MNVAFMDEKVVEWFYYLSESWCHAVQVVLNWRLWNKFGVCCVIRSDCHV